MLNKNKHLWCKKSKILGSLLLLALFVVCTIFINTDGAYAATGINPEVNFQGRLLNSEGATVPDGYYNIEFKIYENGNGQSSGDSTGSPAGTLLWTEDYLNANSQGVEVVDGFLSVQLGSICSFSGGSCQGNTNLGVNWNTNPLWLSMNVAGTGASCSPFSACSPDGEMLPMKELSSDAYSLNSAELNGLSSSEFLQLAQGAQTDSSTASSIFINKTGGSGDLVELQASGNDAFVVTNDGDLTFGNNANHNISVTTAGSGSSGKSLTLTAGAAGTGGSALTGGTLNLQGGAGGGTNGNGGNVSIDAGQASGSGTNGTLSLGSQYASTLTIGNSSSTTTLQGTVNVSGPATFSSLITANGGVTVAGGQNLTLSSGIGTYSQTYVSTATGTDNVATWTVSNGNTGATLTTVNAHNIALAGSSNSSGNDNVTNGVNFANVTTQTGNTFNALNVGTGFTNILQYNGNSLINGTGILQSAAVSGTYSNLTGTGALSTGSIASGFGAISTTNGITTTGTVQGGVVNATTTLELNGASINTASTLSNVAYLSATQTFTGANTFSAAGTALSVTNNATISGTGTIGTLSVTNNGTVGGTLGITGLTTASGGLTVAGGQNLTLSSGIGTYSQTYVSTATGTDNVATWTVSNGNTGATLTTVNAHNIALAGSSNSSGNDNVTNGVNFANVTTQTGNTFNALNVGTGFTNILQYNGNSLINGTGILQSAAVSGTYSNLTGTGALSTGSIASGFGAISTTNGITTTGTVQGGVVNATTTLELNGASINTASTLSNVAYLSATQTFTGANTFSAAGTALSVTNNATISGTGTIGTLSVTNNGTVGGTLGITGLTTASGGLTVAGGQNLTLSSGIGTYSQTYVSTATGTDNVATWTVSNGNTGATLTTVNAHNIALAGSSNSSGNDNVTNGVNFANVTTQTGNTFNALNVGTGFTNILQYNGNSLINGTGILQSAAVSGTYSNLTGTGALSTGSIASGFGAISTTNGITTTGTVQGGVVNATTTLELNGASINTASTLSNVAYLSATQTFTGANTFSAAGTALSVTNNATISGTGTIGTLSVTNNGTVGGTLGITGLTTASGGLTVAGGQNLTLSSGIGTYSQTYVSTATGTDNVATWTVSNGNTGATLTTVNAHNIALAGSSNSSGNDNVTNGVNFANVTTQTGNTFNALNVGTGFTNILQYNGNSLINGTGILQSAAVSGTYSNLTGTGALSTGSIASGFGAISTTNGITTTGTVQGGVVNATTTLELNGASINTASTLSNVAYLSATQTFTGANTFSAAGTALSVTNNATISGTGTIGTLSVTNNGTVGGTLGITGLTTASGGLTVAGGQNLTLSSGIGTYSQTYVSTATGTDNVATWTVSNGNTGATLTTVNAHNIALAGSSNSSGNDNVTNGVNFANVTTQTGNTFNALNVGTGFTNILQYNGNSLINGTGILQSAAVSGTYSNLTGTGALSTGSIASGFGAISTTNGITTTGTVQGGVVNATTTLELNGASINTASTLSNVAYLSATQTFTGANTFSAAGTALSVTNNATISGTGTIGTLSVTNNGTVGGTLGITGLTTASGGLTVAGGQNLTLSSGIGTYSQTYVSTATGTDNVATWTVSNGNTGATLTTVNAHNIALAGSSNSSGNDNVTNGVNFANVTTQTGNTFNALNVGTGFTNILQYNGNSLINGTGILQSAAVSGTYSNLTGTGALSTGSIASGFGAISTTNGITTTGTVQGGVVNATTTLELNGASINTASTLSNVAYLSATQTFTGANTFSAAGTALSVTNNATISGTGTIGTLSVTNNGTVGGTLGITGLTTASGGLTVAGGQNLTLSSGIGTYSQTYVSTATGTDNVATINATNSNVGAVATTVNADNISLIGTNNSNASENTLNGINFSATTATNNTINALNVGTGFTNILQYNGNSLINGTGILQSAAVSGTYSNLTGTGALSTGSIASGFGAISTGNNITTTATLQGGVVNATTTLELNGASINTASTLSNVAYLSATQTFTGANTFSAAGTALSVTNNATISGTGTIGTLSVTNNGTVGGTLGITGLTTASGGLTVAGGQNLTLSSGIGTYSQTYVSTATGTDNVATINATNSNVGAVATTVNADNISLIGTNNSNASENTLNGINFSATTATNNTINALNVGTGFTNILQYNGNSLINGTGILQSAAVSGTYSNLTGTGALSTGSIASGFGAISTGNNITTTATLQGGVVNATTTLELNGASINTASTLSNVAYLSATQTFTGANTFSAAGTALSVTNNATISGTATISTLAAASATVNSGVSGTSGLVLTQIASASSCGSSYCQLLGINSSGQVGASNAAVSLTSPALAYWNGVNDPTTGDQSYPTNPIASYTCSGTCTGSGGTGGFSSGNGELLNPAQANTYGSLNWDFAQVPFEEIQFQVKTNACSLNCSGLTSGADSSWFYGYAGNTNSGGSSIPTTEFGCTIAVGSCPGAGTVNTADSLTEGYIVYFSEYHDCIGIAYAYYADGNQCNNGGGTSNSGVSPLASVALPAGSINDGNWHDVDIQILDNTIYVRWDGNLVLSYTDVYNRDLADYQAFGFGARSGGDVDNHYVRGLLVTKLGSNASEYGIDGDSPLASDLYWDNSATALGVDTSSPRYDLEVDGTAGLEPTVSGQYSVGTACQSNSGTSCSTTAGDLVFGTGTSWSTADVAAGDTIVFSNGESARITTVNSNTELTVSSSQLLASGSTYTIDLGTACIGSSSACTATGTTLTGTHTDFTSAMIGDVINFPDGTTDTITAVSSVTSATVSTSALQAGSNYTIEAGGLVVSNAASATIANVTVGANSTFGANLYTLTETATGTNTYTVPNASYGYDFYTDLTSTTATTDTYNITGLPSTAGTIVYIETEVTDDGANDQYLILEIGGTQISEIKGTATGTYYDDYTLMYSGSAWRIVGQGPQSTSDTQNANDYAEWIDYSGDTAPQPGDVLTVGSDDASVTDSDTPYDPALVGVVSTNPYEVAGADDGHSVVIALAGRVPVKVSLANGPIEPGDPLTSSPIPGVAMLATQPGNIIGTALEAYDGTQSSNQILVQLHVGYDDPTAGSGILQGSQTAGNLAVNGNETVAGNDTVQGSLTADDGINADGSSSVSSLTVADNLSVSGNLDVAGTSDISDLEAQLADVSGQFSVEGNTTLASLLVGNDLTVNGDLTVSGSASIANLAVSGNLSSQNLSVGGTTLLAGDLDLGGQVNTRQATIKTFTSSGPVNAGDAVVLDQTAGNAGDVTTTTTADDPAVIGVAVSSVSGAGDPVQVAIGGWVQVNVDTALNTNGTPLIPITPGELIVTSSVPGAVQASNDPAAGSILGKSTANQDANNQVWLLITLQ